MTKGARVPEYRTSARVKDKVRTGCQGGVKKACRVPECRTIVSGGISCWQGED